MALLFLNACQSDKTEELPFFKLSGSTMGTTYNITIVNAAEELDSQVLQKEIDSLLNSLNQKVSTYISDSEISVFNQKQPNEWYSISQDFLNLVLMSQEISGLTNGFFDMTIGPLVELWGFGKSDNSEIPPDSAIAAAKARVGWQHIQVNPDDKLLSKTKDLALDLSAIAKGYGVDKIADLLELKGVQNFLVEIGGEMKVKGHNAKKTLWTIGIETPTVGRRDVQQVLQLDDQAVATSGDYRNFFEVDGQRFSHTINPNTGRPVRHNIASVTVIHRSAALADGLATALNVMGEEQALALANRENLAAFFILYENAKPEVQYRIEYTDGFTPYLTQD